MASRLVEAHRLAQLRLGFALIRRMRPLWRILKPSDLDGSFQDWLRTVVPVVQAQRSISSTLAANYYTTLRELEMGEGFAPILAGPADFRALSTSMLVTGPVSVKAALKRAVPLGAALDIAEARAARAAMRHALNGGRETLLETMRADHGARGWRRTTSGNPCKFCSMLAGRGAVYSKDTADFQAHDGCSCGVAPVWLAA